MENEATAYLIQNEILFIWRQVNIHRQLNRYRRKCEKASNTPDFIGCEFLFYISAKQFPIWTNWPMVSGCEMHNIGNWMLMSYLLTQIFPPLEYHKPALPWGTYTNFSRFQEIYLSILKWNIADNDFPERVLLQDKLDQNLIQEPAEKPKSNNLSSLPLLI